MSGILDDKTKEILNAEFSTALKKPVTILIFTGISANPEYESSAKNIIDEIVSLPSASGGKLNAQKKSILSPGNEISRYGISSVGRTPAIVLQDSESKDTGIIFHGVPGGHEFRTFIDAIKMVSSGDSGLKAESRQVVASLKSEPPIEIKVFVTLTCPYCPAAVKLAEQFAYESKGKITARIIDASEFSDAASKYSIFSVPTVIINEKDSSTGVPTEEEIAERLMKFHSAV